MDKMPTKIKILLFTMIAGSSLIVASAFINVRGFANFGANIGQIISGQENGSGSAGQENGSTEAQITKSDIDQDGIPDEEEPLYETDPLNPDTDGDGFLDGEEVASGRKPWMPGPNDSINQGVDKNTNVTEKISDLITAGLFIGDLKKDSSPATFNKAIDNLSLAVIYESTLALTPDEIKEKGNTVTDDKKNQERYLDNLIKIIERELMLGLFSEPFEINKLFKNFDFEEPQNNSEIKEYFNARSVIIERAILKFETLEVPQSWRQIHGQIISFLQTLKLHYNSLANLDQDPVKALVALNNIRGLYDDIKPLLSSIAKKIKSENLNIPNNEFLKLLNELYNP